MTSDLPDRPAPPDDATAADVEAFLEDIVLHFVLAREEGGDPDIDLYLAQYPRQAEALAILLGQESGRPVPVSDPSTNARRLRRGWSARRYGAYDVLFHVSSTGSAHVYKARDGRGGPDVALKVIERSELIDQREAKRFQREAGALRELDVPGVVPILEMGESEAGLFLAMPWIDGMTIQELIEVQRGERPSDPLDPADFPTARRITILVELAKILEAVHERGFLHRDLKPSNVMLRRDGRPVLIDFGIARDTSLSRVTRTADMPLGTPRYLAPELLLGDAKSADERTDVYGLGMIAYEFLSGHLAYDAPGREELFQRILVGDVKPLGRVAPDLARAVVKVVNQAMERDPARRWDSVSRFAERLESAGRARSPGWGLLGRILGR